MACGTRGPTPGMVDHCMIGSQYVRGGIEGSPPGGALYELAAPRPTQRAQGAREQTKLARIVGRPLPLHLDPFVAPPRQVAAVRAFGHDTLDGRQAEPSLCLGNVGGLLDKL